ncbi:MAG: polysaccharide deacetylase family protein [Gemmataceae bacterium]
MTQQAFITTSWDDGHPLDLRIAELLARYHLPGTFYVPRESEYGTMSANQVRELSANFELGGHTLNHLVLTEIADATASEQINGCKQWLEETTSRECTMFCAPKGKFQARHLDMIHQAGFAGLRGVDLLSLDLPRERRGIRYMPTTIQAYPHSFPAYARNAIKRQSVRSLLNACRYGRTSDWLKTARSMLEKAMRLGGVFHLWGHSWEIEQVGLWPQLEDAFRVLSEFSGSVLARTNGALCKSVSVPGLSEAGLREARYTTPQPAAGVGP